MAYTFEKAGQSLDKLPFKDRLKAVGALVKNTFTVIGRDEDIIKPWIRMAIYNFVMVTLFFYFVMGNWYEFPLEGWALFISFLLFLYKHFYHNKQEVRLSWTVNQTIIGEDPSYRGATVYSKKIKSQTRKLAWFDIGMALMEKGKFVGKGIVNAILNLIISGIEEVWDLVNHYLLPSVAVDRLEIGESVKKMKNLKNQVPETLVGVFGIDFLGKIVGRVAVPIYVMLILLAGFLGVFATDYFPASEIDFNGEPTMITFVPMVIAVYMGKLFSNLFERVVTSVKVVYFTVFYTKITHPETIMDELKDELTDYLKLDQLDKVDNLDEQESMEVETV
ncbi:hypothetical protein [Gracilimonas sp.]|uniref:hypothetical protein n=1 Tax=Gracilimonas sp. TaxID=1974203 RepID=UPI0032EB1690